MSHHMHADACFIAAHKVMLILCPCLVNGGPVVSLMRTYSFWRVGSLKHSNLALCIYLFSNTVKLIPSRLLIQKKESKALKYHLTVISKWISFFIIKIGTNAQPSILSRRSSTVKAHIAKLLFYTPMPSVCSSLQSVLTLLWKVLHTTWLWDFKSLSAFQPQSLYREQNSCSQPLTCSECVWVYVCMCSCTYMLWLRRTTTFR